MAAPTEEFLIVCLCAEWCGTCRDYRAGFDALQERFADMAFRWVDIEDEADRLADFDLDVENFPTLLVQRGNAVLFCGPMLPDHGLLRRLIESLLAQSAEESARYAVATAERRAWQAYQLRAVLE